MAVPNYPDKYGEPAMLRPEHPSTRRAFRDDSRTTM
jgi:hypothetical protein